MLNTCWNLQNLFLCAGDRKMRAFQKHEIQCTRYRCTVLLFVFLLCFFSFLFSSFFFLLLNAPVSLSIYNKKTPVTAALEDKAQA